VKWAKLKYGFRGVAKSHLTLSLALFICVHSQSKNEVSYTLHDIHRLIRVEEQVQSLRNEMRSLRNELIACLDARAKKFDAKFEALEKKFDAKIEATSKKIDSINTQSEIALWGIGIIVFILMFAAGHFFNYVNKYINPLRLRSESLLQKYDSLFKALREYPKNILNFKKYLKDIG